MNTFRDS